MPYWELGEVTTHKDKQYKICLFKIATTHLLAQSMETIFFQNRRLGATPTHSISMSVSISVSWTHLFSSILVIQKCTRSRCFHRFIWSTPQVMKPLCFLYTTSELSAYLSFIFSITWAFKTFVAVPVSWTELDTREWLIGGIRMREEGMRPSPFLFFASSLPAQLPSGCMELSSHFLYIISTLEDIMNFSNSQAAGKKLWMPHP